MYIGGLVLDFDPAEHRDALDHQCLRGLRRVRLKVPGLVFICAENSRSLQRDEPSLRNSNFTAPKNRARVQDGVAAFEIGTQKINLVSPKNGKQASTFELFCIHLPLPTAKDVQRIELRIGGICRRFLHQRLPEHCHTGHDNKHWPQVPKIQMDDAHFVELEKQTHTNEDHAGRAPARIRDLPNADNHETHWPKVQSETVRQVAHLLEQED